MDGHRAVEPADALRTRRAIELADGIAAGRVQVAYDRTVCLARGLTHCSSAIAHWKSPDGVPAAPGLPGETWLSSALTAAVLHRVARDVGAAGPEARVVVALPAGQLRDTDLPTRIAETFALHHVRPGGIAFAVDLAGATSNLPGAVSTFAALRALGCPVGLDGFGRVLAPAAHLERMAVDFVRIDRTAVSRLLVDPESLADVTTLLHSAHAVGADTIAPGVETEQQAEWLRDLGCGLAEGPLFGTVHHAPVPSTSHPCGPSA